MIIGINWRCLDSYEGGIGILKMDMEELSYNHIKIFHDQHKAVHEHKLINLHTILLLGKNKFQVSVWLIVKLRQKMGF